MFKNIIALSAIVALTTAAPLLLADDHVLHVPVAKSTFTHSSQLVDHGSTYHALPVLHTLGTAKKTVTQSNQVVNHGGTAVVHTPVHYEIHPKMTLDHVVTHSALVHAPVVPVHSSPVVYHSSPYLVNAGDSAVSHHSSTTHETIPVVNSLPLYYHH